MTQQLVWKCEQWFGGEVKEQSVFLSEQQARELELDISQAYQGFKSTLT